MVAQKANGSTDRNRVQWSSPLSIEDRIFNDTLVCMLFTVIFRTSWSPVTSKGKDRHQWYLLCISCQCHTRQILGPRCILLRTKNAKPSYVGILSAHMVLHHDNLQHISMHRFTRGELTMIRALEKQFTTSSHLHQVLKKHQTLSSHPVSPK